MHLIDYKAITNYLIPNLPPQPSDLCFLFGTRHGVPAFCETAWSHWQQGMYARLLVTGGPTCGIARSEADIIADRLVQLGMPASALILETQAMNTGENVIFGRKAASEVLGATSIKSVLLIGKVCSTRRYLMTFERHWPGLQMSISPVNYFGKAVDRWHEDEEFRTRMMGEFAKIPTYLAAGFISELPGYNIWECALVDAAPNASAAEDSHHLKIVR